MEEKKEPIPPEKKLSAQLDSHLRKLMPDQDLSQFRDQLPEEFITDASEGLEQLQEEKTINAAVKQMNHQLHLHLGHKKKHKINNKLGNLSWIYWAVICIILLTVVAYFVIRLLLRH